MLRRTFTAVTMQNTSIHSSRAHGVVASELIAPLFSGLSEAIRLLALNKDGCKATSSKGKSSSLYLTPADQKFLSRAVQIVERGTSSSNHRATAVPEDEAAADEANKKTQREVIRAVFISMPDSVMKQPAVGPLIQEYESLLRAELSQKTVIDPRELLSSKLANGDRSEAPPSSSFSFSKDTLRDLIKKERLVVWQGDMSLLSCDAVVNPANSALLGCFLPSHKCLDNILHAQAGPRLRLACRALRDTLEKEETTTDAEKNGEAKCRPATAADASALLVEEISGAKHKSSTQDEVGEVDQPDSVSKTYTARCSVCGRTFSGPDPFYGSGAGGGDANGQCRVTEAFCLPSRFIFHTVGPDLSSRDFKKPPRPPTMVDSRELRSCYRKCLTTAIGMGLQSIAFCCISTGIFSYPSAEAAQLAVEEVLDVLAEEAQQRRIAAGLESSSSQPKRVGRLCKGAEEGTTQMAINGDRWLREVSEGADKEEQQKVLAIVRSLPIVVFNVFKDEDLSIYQGLLPA